jgi:hypothetical protein
MMMAKMAPELMKAQMQQQRLQAHSADIDATNETSLIKHVAGKIITPHTAHQMMSSMTGMPTPEEVAPPDTPTQ